MRRENFSKSSPCVLDFSNKPSRTAPSRQAAGWRLVRFNASRGARRNYENVGQSKIVCIAFVPKIVTNSRIFDKSCSLRVIVAYTIRLIERRGTLSNCDDDWARV